MSEAESPAPQYDITRVVDNLEQQLGRALGQAARLEAVVAGLLERNNELARERDEAVGKAQR